jgi:hypothetical protein
VNCSTWPSHASWPRSSRPPALHLRRATEILFDTSRLSEERILYIRIRKITLTCKDRRFSERTI